MTRAELERYIFDTYSTEADHPWADAPGNAVFRHAGNRKWFALILDVPREKLAAYKKPFLKSTSDLGLEYDVVVTVTLKDTDTFEKYLDAVPFYQNVRKEGIPLAV